MYSSVCKVVKNVCKAVYTSVCKVVKNVCKAVYTSVCKVVKNVCKAEMQDPSVKYLSFFPGGPVGTVSTVATTILDSHSTRHWSVRRIYDTVSNRSNYKGHNN